MDEYISREAVVRYLKEQSEKELNSSNFGMITSSVLNKAERAISEMPSADVQSVNGWVSVEDRLPEIPKPDEGYCCFLVSDGSLIHIAYYTEDGWLFTDSGEMKEMFYKVTHWMPLPEYPNHLKARMM